MLYDRAWPVWHPVHGLSKTDRPIQGRFDFGDIWPITAFSKAKSELGAPKLFLGDLRGKIMLGCDGTSLSLGLKCRGEGLKCALQLKDASAHPPLSGKYGAILSNFDSKNHPVMLYTPVFGCGSREYIFSAIESHYRIQIFEVTQKICLYAHSKGLLPQLEYNSGNPAPFSMGLRICPLICKTMLGCDGTSLSLGYKLKKWHQKFWCIVNFESWVQNTPKNE